ncbi:MAG TPA: OmpA family protein [Nitrospira sp.]|nr:peptidoglycan-associated lipoprotein [Nitrospira sp. NTP1]HQR13849.1 OmpA family protein [Nitrospira sp.]HQV11937.1 OmpA family protein [Nitrospira sp.]
MIVLRPFALLGLLAVAASFLLDGCASKAGTSGGATVTPPKPHVEERIAAAPVQEIPPPPEPAPVPLRSVEMAARNATGEQNIPFPDVLFDFDQYVLRDDALNAVEANAKRLKDNRVTKVLLEGRCDEIGTAEYNLVLGERRALSVKRYLESLGLNQVQVDVTSYGKDRPLCLQHNPVCWQKNRSVHFVVKE